MISQYANSPKYVKLVEGIREQFNNYKTIQDWYNVVYNIRTATGYGLDWWGKILDQSRLISFIDDNNQKVEIFLQGEITVDGITFSADEIENLYRTLLIFRAMSNIGNATIPSLEMLLNSAFEGRGQVYIDEVTTMQIDVTFNFYVNKLEKYVFSTDIFPKPTGVGVNFYYVPSGSFFGFFVDGASPQPFAPFDNKPFYNHYG